MNPVREPDSIFVSRNTSYIDFKYHLSVRPEGENIRVLGFTSPDGQIWPLTAVQRRLAHRLGLVE